MFPKLLFITLFLIIVCGTLNISTLELKITDAKLDYLNGNYIDKNTYAAGLIDVNSTYARLPLFWEVLTSFPMDATLETRIVRYNSPQDKRGSSFNVKIEICNIHGRLYQYLPPFLIDLTKAGQCVQPGNYSFYDAGQLQFNKFLSSRDLDGAYRFNTINYIASPSTYIKKIEIASKPV
ncbi:uncharacterized protein LOC100117399 [Nasonia vitripennis]|uniref:Uncharacterized protein n=1 Tax=Nasonia vitripennis TaxID=7425 RepID=A0A7M7G2T1_NASVI|nr:uncharacterized protein LOC100117399 [Nasonia vitripennis]